MFMGLRVEKDRRPSTVAGSQSTIVLSILYYIHCAYYLQIANIWSFSLLCMHTYHVSIIKSSQPKQVLLEARELVDLEKVLELVLEKEKLEVELEKVKEQQQK